GEFILNDNSVINVEVTVAVDGHNESLIDERLKKHRHVDAFQEVKYSGTKYNRDIPDTQPTTHKIDDIIQKSLGLITIALEKKLSKTNNSEYNNAYLVIGFNDYILPINYDINQFRLSINQVVQKQTKKLFSKIFIVGNKDYFF
ncbi:hypothetical protein ACFL0U_02530, partial [Pseudomonadota bacterium]